VLRGADGNPHQVRLDEARAVELAGRASAPMGVPPATLEVAPNRDLFVPFEFPVAELPAGWYAIECALAIDGTPQTVRPGPRFAVPWPRGSTRRDQIAIGRTVRVGDDAVRLERLECAGDSTRVRYEGSQASISLSADGARVPVLDASFDPETSVGAVTAYPLLRTHGRLTIAVKGAGDPVEVRLP
jgi:hypothetical protein